MVGMLHKNSVEGQATISILSIPQTQHHHRDQQEADTYQFDQFPQRFANNPHS